MKIERLDQDPIIVGGDEVVKECHHDLASELRFGNTETNLHFAICISPIKLAILKRTIGPNRGWEIVIPIPK